MPGGTSPRRIALRTRPRPRSTCAPTLTPVLGHGPGCPQRLCADYAYFRTVTTRDAVLRLPVHLRRCHNPAGRRSRRPSRPQAAPHLALPHQEFGLDVSA
jgi:hypothetical protein